MDLKSAIEELAGQLTALEATARKLQNQNFADIVKAAHVRVTQLTQHPDIDKVDELARAEHGGNVEQHGETQGVFPAEAKAAGVEAIPGSAVAGRGGPPFPA